MQQNSMTSTDGRHLGKWTAKVKLERQMALQMGKVMGLQLGKQARQRGP